MRRWASYRTVNLCHMNTSGPLPGRIKNGQNTIPRSMSRDGKPLYGWCFYVWACGCFTVAVWFRQTFTGREGQSAFFFFFFYLGNGAERWTTSFSGSLLFTSQGATWKGKTLGTRLKYEQKTKLVRLTRPRWLPSSYVEALKIESFICYSHSCLLLGAKGKGYGTFHEEAVRVFGSLLEQESIADPIPVIQVRYWASC